MPILISTLSLVSAIAACGPGGPAGAGPPGAPQADEGDGKIDPAVRADKGPRIDLKNVSLTATISEPEALNMGTIFAFDKLRQWGAKVNEVTLTTTSGIQTMIAGRSDLGSHGADEVVLGRSQGAKVTAIGSGLTKQAYVLVTKDSIKNVAGLKGRTIAMSGPSGFDTLLSKYALRQAGLKNTDAKLAQIGGSPDRSAALLSGSVDAATIFSSDWENLKPKTEDLHVIEDFSRTTNFPGDAYFMNTDHIQKNPKLALGIACANLEANAWINSSQQEFVEFTQRHVEAVDPESVKAIWQNSQESDYFPTSPGEVLSPTGMSALQKAMRDSGDISGNASMADAVDTSHLKEASAMGCGK